MSDKKDVHFFADPDIDRLLSMFLALASEVAVLRDRLDTHEQLAEQGTLATADQVQAFEASPDLAAERERWRTRYLRRVMAKLSQEMAEYADSSAS